MKKALSTSMSSPRRIFWIMIFTMLILGGLLSLGIFLFTPDVASANEILPISLHSPLAADYSADPRGYLVPAMGLDVLVQIDQDRRATGTAVVGDTLPTLVEILKTPVPTITPSAMAPQASPTLRPTLPQLPQSTATRGPTSTPEPASTASAIPATQTALPTRTIEVQPSATRLPPTTTSVPPSATPVTPKATKTSKPTVIATTDVPPKPTNTPRPTDVPPTATSVPPTPIPPTPIPPTPIPPTQPPPPTSYPPPPPYP